MGHPRAELLIAGILGDDVPVGAPGAGGVVGLRPDGGEEEQETDYADDRPPAVDRLRRIRQTHASHDMRIGGAKQRGVVLVLPELLIEFRRDLPVPTFLQEPPGTGKDEDGRDDQVEDDLLAGFRLDGGHPHGQTTDDGHDGIDLLPVAVARGDRAGRE